MEEQGTLGELMYPVCLKHRAQGTRSAEETRREACTLGHYSDVNDFDLPPKGIGKPCIILSWPVTQSNVGFQKVTLPAAREAYSQG